MKEVDAKKIWKMLALCRYIKWKNVKNFDELNKEKINERSKKSI